MKRLFKKSVIFVILVLLIAGLTRYLVEFKIKKIVADRVEIYCKKNSIPILFTGPHQADEIGLIRSTYDYTFRGSKTHRLRIYVTIFLHVEFHVLIEDS